MKALSLWQPWASAIAASLKQIETRGWYTSYTGPLAIHAAKRWTREEQDFLLSKLNGVSIEYFRRIGIVCGHDVPLGCIVATCEIYGCRRTEDLLRAGVVSEEEREWGNFSEGRFGWLLHDIRPLPVPIACIGRQGLFDWNSDASPVAKG
jgi:hypothetical protein